MPDTKKKKVELPIVRLFRLAYMLVNALMTFVGLMIMTMMITIGLTAILIVMLLVRAIIALF